MKIILLINDKFLCIFQVEKFLLLVNVLIGNINKKRFLLIHIIRLVVLL